ncbi:Universal stress protein F [Roseobacter fucihabitans]|uniref:Universal stress protein F n=1 Tax=Roseobacter fucihabitans TaxID=1537242 RepID=A0ABZ2BNB1_9RHOB|nr:universal stress protein [Roseobacter litoralis]MBC6963564.1 Universal stress protein F [Roseobacter litoralis]
MYKNILVPVLFDEGHDTQASYRAAHALASEGARYSVIHVLEEIPAYASSEIPHDVLEKSQQVAADALKDSAQALPGAKVALISGHAGKTIVDYASENGIDCIVMASHRPGIEDFFLGSTASRVVRHAKCSVHIIR